ncbi:MAG TPA: TRCF domain-containing protein, partial [Bacteroidota bacterium]|nr:TRCF domain-containing protein [Bacteroidota bacterium]
RDLSMITTPPRNRLPIITEIIPASDGRRPHWQVVREAILKELHRDGQAYFVHDRVQNIGAIADQLKSHCPEARVHIAHGQMHGSQLEQTMLNFLEKKYDVLVCTKIIESGLDIPNVNTIIINRADQFGLAELYQLRGRVGRANLQAFAYLLVPPVNALPKQTLRRLQAIEEFTELGSGFNLAMRDLEIRGAGNIFGAEQSGFIIEMGFETYERIVREAVEELYREEFKDIAFEQRSLRIQRSAMSLNVEPRTMVEYDITALIPDLYIEADNERLDIYRRLYRINSTEDLQTLREELRDRFGEYPEEVENLFQLIDLRNIASSIDFPKISLKGGKLIVTLPDQTNEAFYNSENNSQALFQKIMRKISEDRHHNVQVKQSGKELRLEYSCHNEKSIKDYLMEARKKLEEIRLCCELSTE